MDLTHQLTPDLKRLRLSGVLETLEIRNQQAIDEKWSYIEFLSRLLEDEVQRRDQKQLALRVRRATINSTKTLETFDFSFNPTINRQQILDLAGCLYIQQKRNVIICGPTGVGKSHLAQALAHEACRRGYNVLFTSTYHMLGQLNAGRADDTYQRRLNNYLKPDLLIIDDFGLKPLRPPGPEDLYDVISQRYEQGSILLTSNRSPAELYDLFNDPLLASAALDRLLHGAHAIIITGDSFRTQGHRWLEGKEVAMPET
ncbi:MAG: hypothetical protein D6791_13785 [Chloroflexi bacterium]|nr:MAG: hypothetical protein D6791_13785 [Chloroflexota bacterium]